LERRGNLLRLLIRSGDSGYPQRQYGKCAQKAMNRSMVQSSMSSAEQIDRTHNPRIITNRLFHQHKLFE
jgi:hypothetical protein